MKEIMGKTKLDKFEDWLEEYKLLDNIYWFFKLNIESVWSAIRSLRYFLKNKVYDYQVYNLDNNIAKFVLPRLKLLRKDINGYPESVGSFENWLTILDKVIWSFERELDWTDYKKTKEDFKKYEEGIELFGEHWRSFWD